MNQFSGAWRVVYSLEVEFTKASYQPTAIQCGITLIHLNTNRLLGILSTGVHVLLSIQFGHDMRAFDSLIRFVHLLSCLIGMTVQSQFPVSVQWRFTPTLRPSVVATGHTITVYYCVPLRYSRCLICVFSFRQVHCISFVCSTFGRFRALEVHTHLAQGYGRFCEA